MNPCFLERASIGNLYTGRVQAGEDLHQAITHLASVKGERRMLILSAVGTLKDVTLRNLRPDSELPITGTQWAVLEEPGPFEIIQLTGHLLPMGGEPVLHLHVALGRSDGSLVGGHVDAATVFSSVELFMASVDGSWVVKSPDPDTGLAELSFAAERRSV